MTDDAGGDALAGPPCFSVGLLPLPNFTLVAFAGFIDTLRLAADEGDRSRQHACRWTILAPTMRPVRSSCGAEVVPMELLEAPFRFDCLVVAGGLLPGRDRSLLDPRSRDFIREAARTGVTVIGICTGSFALAEAGLLRAGSRCCVSWYHYQDLQVRFPKLRPVADQLWVREGAVITCAGGLAAVDLAATLVQAHVGAGAAQKSLHIMQVDRLRSAAAAQPQPPNTLTVADRRVRRAMLLMEQNLAAPLSAGQLAASVSVSKRQLERLFRRELGVSIQSFARDLRLSAAVWQMAELRGRITDIAAQCGFADAAHFSRVFREAFGCSPSAAQSEGKARLHAMLQEWWPHADARAEASVQSHSPRPQVVFTRLTPMRATCLLAAAPMSRHAKIMSRSDKPDAKPRRMILRWHVIDFPSCR